MQSLTNWANAAVVPLLTLKRLRFFINGRDLKDWLWLCIRLFGLSRMLPERSLKFFTIWPLNDKNALWTPGSRSSFPHLNTLEMSLCSTQAITETAAQHSLWNKEWLKMSKENVGDVACPVWLHSPTHTHGQVSTQCHGSSVRQWGMC